MVRRFSVALGSTPRAFKKAGVFDGFIEVDTKLYVDPHLISTSDAPEIEQAADYFRQYFEEIIHILKHAPSPRSVFWRQAKRKLMFREIPQLSRGYSIDDIHGSAIGPKLAASITKTAHEIIKEGIEDPEVFELIGLLEEGIGADRISDMTVAVIQEYLLRYLQRIASELELSTKRLSFRETAYRVPSGEGNINPQGEATEVLIIAREKQFAVYLNGQPVFYGEDADLYVPGSINLSCGPNDTETTYEWDNVKVWNLTAP